MKLSRRIVGPCLLLGASAFAGCAGDLASDSGNPDDSVGNDGTEQSGDQSSDTGAKPAGLPPAQTARHIVKFKDSKIPLKSLSLDQRMNVLKDNLLHVERSGGVVKKLLGRINAVSAELTSDQVTQLMANDQVEFIERDPIREVLGPVKKDIRPLSEQVPYGITMVQATQLSDSAAGNRKICITDTGYDATHPDLRARTATNLSGVDNDGEGNDTGNWYQDGAGHGSHVSGTISATGGNGIGVVGIMPNNTINIHMVKVFNDDGNWAYGSDMIAAIEQCVNAGANVISMSLGGPEQSNAERQAFEEASAAGVLSIAAAGNDGNTSFSYPASYDVVMSVAAIDSSKRLASFSQRNSQVEIAAPGVGVLSTTGGGYQAWDGTSMATPHVSGVAALVWSLHPNCTNVDVRNALNSTAQDLGSTGRDTSYGYGLVQAKAASDYLSTQGCGGDNPPPPPPPPPPPSNGTELTNGVAKTGLSGAKGSTQGFFINVPGGATSLTISTSGGSGDADLYMKAGSAPTLTSYDCRPYKSGNSESCTVPSPAAGTYYVMLNGYSSYSGVSLTGSYTTSPGGGTCDTATYTATDVPKNIPDNDSAGVRSTINVSLNKPIGTLTLNTNITHTYRGDLVATLIGPDGTQYLLSNRSGGSADNLVLSGTIPSAAGKQSGGNWQLLVQDLAARDVGKINSFSLTIAPNCN
jgi:serine protease